MTTGNPIHPIDNCCKHIPNLYITMASPSPARPPTENQLSSNPGVHVQVTTHNNEGKAVVKSTTPVKVCISVDEYHG